MTKDFQHHQLSGATPEAARHYEHAVEAFNLYRGDPLALADQALAIAPDFAMAHLLKAHLFCLSSEPIATLQAKIILDGLKSMRLNEREAGHASAIESVIAGEWTAAALQLDRHSMRFPRDLLALQAGHLIDFYRANARNLRDRITRALPQWSQQVPGYSTVLGFLAFGLEEMGDYHRAEETGRRAVELQPLDGWAHHAVAHVMEMQGRSQDGIDWMISREPHWAGDANFFKVHNWWHRALFHLDLGQPDRVLALYDERIRKDRTTIALELVDASALLWRLSLTGFEVGERWLELATAWDNHADGRTYPFNDWHAVMAYLGAGRMSDVTRIVSTFKTSAADGEVAVWGHRTALPLIEGFVAFWSGDYQRSVELLHPARFIANAFGGSHAQRDIIDWTLTEAAVRSAQRDVAQALASERLASKPHSPINKAFFIRSGGTTASGLAA